MSAKHAGFFTRPLEDMRVGERHKLAAERIIQAERHGFDSA